MNLTETRHVHHDDQGVAWIDETRVKVIEVVMDQMAHGWSPQEIHRQHPTLSLAQIHAALSYYYDHRDEIDAMIRARLTEVDDLVSKLSVSPIVERMRRELPEV